MSRELFYPEGSPMRSKHSRTSRRRSDDRFRWLIQRQSGENGGVYFEDDGKDLYLRGHKETPRRSASAGKPQSIFGQEPISNLICSPKYKLGNLLYTFLWIQSMRFVIAPYMHDRETCLPEIITRRMIQSHSF